MSKYTGVGENQGSHCGRKKMKIWTVGERGRAPWCCIRVGGSRKIHYLKYNKQFFLALFSERA